MNDVHLLDSSMPSHHIMVVPLLVVRPSRCAKRLLRMAPHRATDRRPRQAANVESPSSPCRVASTRNDRSRCAASCPDFVASAATGG